MATFEPGKIFGYKTRPGEAGIRLLWTHGSDCCWRLETRIVPTPRGLYADTAVVSLDPDAYPLAAKPAPPPQRRIEVAASEFLQTLFNPTGVECAPIEQLGFTADTLHPIKRPRGQPAVPEVVFAAVAVLWSESNGYAELEERLQLGRIAGTLRNFVYVARERSYLTGGGRGRRDGNPTDRALRLLEADRREPDTILATWLRDRR